MKKRTIAILLSILLLLAASPLPVSASSSAPQLFFRMHLSGTGWESVFTYAPGMCGTTGQSRQAECLELHISNCSGSITAKCHVACKGDLPSQTGNDLLIGTVGEGLGLECISLMLNGAVASEYSIQYRTHVATIGWLDWARDGQESGTKGRALSIEAIEIKLVPKNSAPSTTTYYVKTNGSNLNVRSAPSSSSPKVGSLYNGAPVSVYSISNTNWATIAFNGQCAYVYASYLTHSVGESAIAKLNSFLSSPDFQAGTYWPSSQRPKLSTYSCSGCCAFTADLVWYVYGKKSPRSGKKFTNPDEIRAGDVLLFSPSHWAYVISRNGNSVELAHGNWNSHVVVATYTLQGYSLLPNKTISYGYHFQ